MSTWPERSPRGKGDGMPPAIETPPQKLKLSGDEYDRLARAHVDIVAGNIGNSVSSFDQVRKDIDRLLASVVDWCRRQGDIAECMVVPTADHILFVVRANTDETGDLRTRLSDSVKTWEADSRFAIDSVLFFASEVSGVRAAIRPGITRTVFNVA